MNDAPTHGRPLSAAPTVTVLLPVYNAERFLRESVDSILSQTWRDFELLAIDDGSTDASLSILREYDDPRIRIIVNPRNLGLTATLNNGIRQARSDLVARMDADDIAVPARLEKQLQFLHASPQVALVGSWGYYVDENDRVLQKVTLPHSSVELRRELIHSNCFFHASVVFRRDAVLAVGGYDGEVAHAQDYDLWLRIAARYQVANIPDFLIRYRVHSGQISFTRLKAQHRAMKNSQRAMVAVWRAKGWLDHNRVSDGVWATLVGSGGSLGERYNSEADVYVRMGDMRQARRLALRAVLCSPLSSEYWLDVLALFLPTMFSPARLKKLRWFRHCATQAISRRRAR
jgi:glycosyltransferase involved in cell wall biosynthesis